jgi:hypothetical protein
MAWEEYMLVRDSDLYELKRLAKPLLAQIALLVIGAPEIRPDGKPVSEPDPDEGWCVATQDYLAAALGCSDDEAQELIAMFERDGWLRVKRFRDKRGHKRNHYALLRQEEIKARKMKKDESGHFVRLKNPKMARANRGTAGRFTTGKSNAKRQVAVRPNGKLPHSQTANSGKPNGYLPESEGFRGKAEGSSVCINARIPSERAGETPATPKTQHTPAKLTKHTPVPVKNPETIPNSAPPLPDDPANHSLWCKCEPCLAMKAQPEFLEKIGKFF